MGEYWHKHKHKHKHKHNKKNKNKNKNKTAQNKKPPKTRPISSQTSLVNNGFIIWPKHYTGGKKASNPERQEKLANSQRLYYFLACRYQMLTSSYSVLG